MDKKETYLFDIQQSTWLFVRLFLVISTVIFLMNFVF